MYKAIYFQGPIITSFHENFTASAIVEAQRLNVFLVSFADKYPPWKQPNFPLKK